METYGVRYLGKIHGPINSECVLHIPGSPWVIMSSQFDKERRSGCLTAVHGDTHEILYLVPERKHAVYDGSVYDPTLLRLGPGELYSHGMAIKKRADGVHTLYVVNHNVADRSGRDSIEVFELPFVDGRPVLRHLGGILVPLQYWPTDLAALPQGEEGFMMNSLVDPADERKIEKMGMGDSAGHLLTWTPDEGWSLLPLGPFPCPNGLEISRDGQYVYIACWTIREIWRFERGISDPPFKRVHANGVLVDNLTWDRDGNLLCAGGLTDPVTLLEKYHSSGNVYLPMGLVKIDPETLSVTTLASGWGPDGWGLSTSAVEIGEEIWVGSARSDAILRFSRTA